MVRAIFVALLAALLVACGDGRDAAQVSVAPSADAGGLADKDVVLLGDPSQCATPTAAVYRFRRTGGPHMLVADEATRARMQADAVSASFDGEIFRQVVCGQAGVPLYRFTDRNTGAEFYTADPVERDRTRIYRAELRYDGVAFYLPVGRLPGTVPVYRLSRAGDYAFTASVAERDRLDFVEGWHLDGVAFHAYPAQAAAPNCPAGQYWDPASAQCTALCPLATDVFVPGAGCQKKRACTGGTLIAETNSCQCDGGLLDNPATDRCEPPPCGMGQIFVVGKGCQVTTTCFGGTVNDQNQCTCPANHRVIELDFSNVCRYDNSFYADGGSGGGDGGGAGAGGDGGTSLGAVKNALVEFWGVIDHKLVLLAMTVSDPVDGLVHFRQGDYDGPAWVRYLGREGATYYDEALGKDVPFPEGSEMNALVGRLDRSLGVTPLTEAAYRYARMHFRSPGMTEPQKVELILENGYYNEANELVRNAFNASMPAASSVTTEVTQFAYPITSSTAPGSLPNDKPGRYALQMASTTYAAKAFNEQLRRSSSMSGVVGAPALAFAKQLAADLSDGTLDARVDGKTLAPTDQRTYTTRSSDLSQLGMPGNFLLSDTLATGVYTAAVEYASPSLTAAVLPPNACLGPNAPTFYSNGYGPLCCPASRVTPNDTWGSGCPLTGRQDYRRVRFVMELPSVVYASTTAEVARALIDSFASYTPLPANLGCSGTLIYPNIWELYVDLSTFSPVLTGTASLFDRSYGGATLREYHWVNDQPPPAIAYPLGTQPGTFSPCPAADGQFILGLPPTFPTITDGIGIVN